MTSPVTKPVPVVMGPTIWLNDTVFPSSRRSWKRRVPTWMFVTRAALLP